MVEWGGQTGLLMSLNQVLVWENGNTISPASWTVQQDATPGDVSFEPSNAS
jgi:hypothetical protein